MPGPLDGIRVIDFTTLLPGPCATMHLADMGAEVIRIESFTRPDMVRLLPPRVGQVSAAHAYLNRNKASVAVDLKQPQAVEWVMKLIETADVLVEQFRPGVMKRLGLDYDTVRDRQPGIVYCSITGYGQTGPLANRAGHDINYLALSGAAHNSGTKEHGPALNGIQIADIAGGTHHAVMAIEAALIHKLRTGQGDYIDISMADAAVSLNHLAWANALAGGALPGPESDVLNGAGIYGYYRTADGRYMSVGSLEPQFAAALCAALNAPEKLSLITSQAPEDRKRARTWLAECFAQRTQAEWIRVFEETDACVEPVLTFEEVQAHPHFNERGLFTETHGIHQVASPLRFTSTEGAPREVIPGKPLGADTRRILIELGATEEELETLIRERAFQAS